MKKSMAITLGASLVLILSACGSSAPVSVEGPGALAGDQPTAPPSDKDTRKYQWYAGNPKILRASSGAPILGQSEAGIVAGDDGVMGMVKNASAHDVLVESSYYACSDCGVGQAILQPGDELPYQFFPAGELTMSRMEGGAVAPGTTSKLWLKDPYVGRPDTKFTPPGLSDAVNERKSWKEGDSADEVWGGTRITVKREKDGWRIPASDEYKKIYGDPNSVNNFDLIDLAIFTITIHNL